MKAALHQKSVLRRQFAGRRAFTLVDVTISVLILGIMSAVAAPRFVDSLQRRRVLMAARKIQADLQFARRTAMARGTDVTFQFDTVLHQYSIVGVDRADRVGVAFLVDLTDSPYESKLVSADLGGDTIVQFNYHGVPDSGGTVRVQAGSYQQTVTIDPDTGRATIP